MNQERKRWDMWQPLHAGKYSPRVNKTHGTHTEEEVYGLMCECHKQRGENLTEKQVKLINEADLRFDWQLKSEFEEKRLRSYDCFFELKGAFMPRYFFVHDWLLECWHDLVDKDLRLVKMEGYTLNGAVKEFHLVGVQHVVEGLERETTLRTRIDVLREEDFMGDCQLAADKLVDIYMYMSPALKERTLKAKKKLKGARIWIL